MSESFNVRTPSREYQIMERDRRFPSILADGYDAIVRSSISDNGPFWPYPSAAGIAFQQSKRRGGFVVQHPAETEANFQTRLELLEFDDFYWSACQDIAAMPFAKPVTWSKGTSEAVRAWESNVETTSRLNGAAGRDLRAFARDCCTNAVGYGMGMLFANKLETADRPYLTYIPGSSILDVLHRTDGRASRPMRMRLLVAGSSPGPELARDARGMPWTTVTYYRVMVLYDGDPAALPSSDEAFASYEIYDQETPGDPESPWRNTPTVARTPMRPQRAIPGAHLYAGYDGPWFSRPTLRALARKERSWINKKSDLDFNVKTAMVPMYNWSGVTAEDAAKQGHVVAAGKIYRSEQSQARFSPVEFQGTSQEMAAKQLDRLLREIEVMKLSPNVTRPTGNETATGRAIDASKAIIRTEAMAMGWGDSFSQAFQFMGIYDQLPPSEIERIAMEFYHSFGVSQRDVEYAQLLTQAYLADPPKCSPERWFTEMKRIGAFGDDVDPKKEAEWVEKAEATALEAVIGAAAARGTAPNNAPRDTPPPKKSNGAEDDDPEREQPN